VTTRQETVSVWQDRVPFRVHVKGTGPALIYFHGPWGLTWGAFHDALAQRFTVYAPEHPGTTPGQPDAIRDVDSLWDLVLCYDELLDRLGLSEVALVGHSFGAMVACEVAALRPARARRLALLDPIGLWRDDAPVTNWMLVGPPELPAYVFRDAEGSAARALFSIPDDPEDGALARTRLTWAMGSTGKFIWPIPDKGLKKRIHRISATPTLLVWGEDDRLVPRVYAEEFARRLGQTRTEIIKDAGHAPHLEQPAATARAVTSFLAP
jgi:pimeloyl-ACP methyl ester carboxylesterase